MEHGHGERHEPIPIHLKTQAIVNVSVHAALEASIKG
jgi:hypothetical protein